MGARFFRILRLRVQLLPGPGRTCWCGSGAPWPVGTPAPTLVQRWRVVCRGSTDSGDSVAPRRRLGDLPAVHDGSRSNSAVRRRGGLATPVCRFLHLAGRCPRGNRPDADGSGQQLESRSAVVAMVRGLHDLLRGHGPLDLLQLAQLSVFSFIMILGIGVLRQTTIAVHERVLWVVSAVVLLFVAGPGAQVWTGHSDLRPLADLWSLSMLVSSVLPGGSGFRRRLPGVSGRSGSSTGLPASDVSRGA